MARSARKVHNSQSDSVRTSAGSCQSPGLSRQRNDQSAIRTPPGFNPRSVRAERFCHSIPADLGPRDGPPRNKALRPPAQPGLQRRFVFRGTARQVAGGKPGKNFLLNAANSRSLAGAGRCVGRRPQRVGGNGRAMTVGKVGRSWFGVNENSAPAEMNTASYRIISTAPSR